MRIDSSGNVGIGTTSPSSALHIANSNQATSSRGNLYIASDTAYAVDKGGQLTLGGTYVTGQDSDTFFGSIAGRKETGTSGDVTGYLSFATRDVSGNTERLRIDSSGNVGIGTTSPDKALTISASDSQVRLYDADGTNQFAAFQSDNGIAKITSRNNTSHGQIAFQRYNGTTVTDSMRIDSSGNVGIGTTSPATFGVLAVKKDQTADTAISVSNAGSSSASTTMSFTLNESGTTQGWLRRYRDGTGNTEVGFSDALLFSGNVTGSKTERMRIDSSGNVGIGITSPSKPLHIYSASDTAIRLQNSTTGTGTTDGLLIEQSGLDSLIVNYEAGNLRFHTSNSERMRLDASGRLGIGTSSPAAKLSIDGGTAGNYTDGISLQKSGGNVYGIYPSTNNLEFRSVTGGNHIATFDYFGNVGIGNSSPARNLSINATSPHLQLCNSTTGTTAGNGFELAVAGNTAYIMQREDANMIIGTNDTERMRIDSSGNVLVGTTDTSLYNNGAGGNTGVVVEPSGTIQLAKSNNICAYLNRLDSDGTILDLRKDGTVVGSIGCEGIKLKINSVGDGVLQSNGSDRYVWDTSQFYPSDDNLRDLGFSSFRWDDIYATNGTIQTSDRNEKQDIEALTDAETRVAVAAKKLLRKFRWKDAVAEKGDEARTHFGIIAQDLQDAFTAEGLDAGDYAMFISSTWTNDDGVEQTRLGVRYNELLAFIIAAI